MSNEIISLRIPKSLKKRLDKAAEKEGRTVSGFVRHHLDGVLSTAVSKPLGNKTGASKTG